MNQIVRGSLLLTLFAVSLLVAGPLPARALPRGPQYDEKGDLKRPEGFQTWVFVGANIGLSYRKDSTESVGAGLKPAPQLDPSYGTKLGNFHNVFVQPEAYDHYLKTGRFPDLTMLVMDVYEAKERDGKGIVSKGLFPGERRSVEVAVKNSKRPDGSKTDWAYYAFERPTQRTAKAFPDSACYDCHRQHADVDNVWVQFYPILRTPDKHHQK
jgi:hypothetical protein